MANRAAIEGSNVLLGAALGERMREHFNADIEIAGHLEDLVHEDIHLVLEYSKGEKWRNFEAPRANRYYLNHDIYNAQVCTAQQPQFIDSLNVCH